MSRWDPTGGDIPRPSRPTIVAGLAVWVASFVMLFLWPDLSTVGVDVAQPLAYQASVVDLYQTSIMGEIKPGERMGVGGGG